MREILFRGKDIRGVWHIGLLARIGNVWYIFNEEMGVATAFEVIPDSIGQYTGLNDQNGASIFEGDIVSIPEEDEIGKVEWREDDAAFVVVCDHFEESFLENLWGRDVEVIGNIYDNPDFLKGEGE